MVRLSIDDLDSLSSAMKSASRGCASAQQFSTYSQSYIVGGGLKGKAGEEADHSLDVWGGSLMGVANALDAGSTATKNLADAARSLKAACEAVPAAVGAGSGPADSGVAEVQSEAGNLGTRATNISADATDLSSEISELNAQVGYLKEGSGHISGAISEAVSACNDISGKMDAFQGAIEGVMDALGTAEGSFTQQFRGLSDLRTAEGMPVLTSQGPGMNAKGGVKLVWNEDSKSWIPTSASVYGEVNLYGARVTGKAESANGLAEADFKVDVMAAQAKGEISASMIDPKTGKLKPEFKAKGEISVAELQGEANGRLGSDDFNVHGKAKGALNTAYAKGEVSFSKDSFKAGGEVGYYAAKGEVSGGFTLFGIKFDVKAEGGVGGASAKFGCKKEGKSAGFDIGGGLGIGGGLSFNVDWSGFKFP